MISYQDPPVIDGICGAILIHHKHFIHPRKHSLVVWNGKGLPVNSDTQPMSHHTSMKHDHKPLSCHMHATCVPHFSSLLAFLACFMMEDQRHCCHGSSHVLHM